MAAGDSGVLNLMAAQQQILLHSCPDWNDTDPEDHGMCMTMVTKDWIRKPSGMQDLEVQLRVFGESEGKHPEAWTEFFKKVNELEGASALLACKQVLSALVWSGDVMAAKAANHEGAYADATMFVRNWGSFAPEVVQTASGLKQKADSVAEALLQAKDKMQCLKCGNANHLNSMYICFVKKRSSYPARRRDREEEDKKEDHKGGFGETAETAETGDMSESGSGPRDGGCGRSHPGSTK
jgi:hypothetical protein